MTRGKHALHLTVLSFLLLFFVADASAQRGPPPGKGPRGKPDQQADMKVFHFLLDHREDITRKVKKLPDGVETLTESDKPEVAVNIQTHVQAMYKRLEEGRPIHMRDPLFRELFRHADKIELMVEKTEKGVKVKETSDDPYVAQLIQAHAEVVSLFLKNGHLEMRKDHPLP